MAAYAHFHRFIDLMIHSHINQVVSHSQGSVFHGLVHFIQRAPYKQRIRQCPCASKTLFAEEYYLDKYQSATCYYHTSITYYWRKRKQNRTWNSKPSFCSSSSGTQLGDEADVTLRGNYQPRTQASDWESWDRLVHTLCSHTYRVVPVSTKNKMAEDEPRRGVLNLLQAVVR